MIVTGQLNNLGQVVIGVLLICVVLDAVDEGDEVLVRDRELLEQAILLEETETEVSEEVIADGAAVLKDVEVPLLKVVHHSQDLLPLTVADIHDLLESLFFLLNLMLVDFTLLAMELL